MVTTGLPHRENIPSRPFPYINLDFEATIPLRGVSSYCIYSCEAQKRRYGNHISWEINKRTNRVQYGLIFFEQIITATRNQKLKLFSYLETHIFPHAFIGKWWGSVYQSKVYIMFFVFFFVFYPYFTMICLLINMQANNHKKILWFSLFIFLKCTIKLFLLSFWRVGHSTHNFISHIIPNITPYFMLNIKNIMQCNKEKVFIESKSLLWYFFFKLEDRMVILENTLTTVIYSRLLE